MNFLDDLENKIKNENNKNKDNISLNDIKKEMEELYSTISYHANLYYNLDSPEIKDFEYDQLMNRLKELEEKYPEFKRDDSLSSNIGGVASSTFEKVEHKVSLQSLQDVFDLDELRDFDIRVKKGLNKKDNEKIEYIVETKIDGLSAALEYLDGKLILRCNKR